MGLTKKLSDRLRRALEIHKPRQLPPAGPVPRYGAYIAKTDVRIWINEEVSYDLWCWLVDRGWREIDLATDRRRYRAARPSAIDELAFANLAHREEVEARLLATAEMTEFERNRKAQPQKQR
ncbi:MAG TPA: hypothetical protein VFS42_08945 [Burkholderiaceae bacterium]|nr:hypothetical protein [Burkholderiaceae bacterium]